jgi:hypothetical protein
MDFVVGPTIRLAGKDGKPDGYISSPHLNPALGSILHIIVNRHAIMTRL